MRTTLICAAAIVLSVSAALVVLAQLSDSQTASGSVTVSSTSADLYICEPGSTTGPDCGSDDSGADEAIFEALEDVRPGETREWDIRLKNVGSVDFLITTAEPSIVETSDPDSDCPDDALKAPQLAYYYPPAVAGVILLGKAGDPVNDNPYGVAGAANFAYEIYPGFSSTRNITIAPGDYEDVRLQIQLPLSSYPSPTYYPYPSPYPTATPPSGTIEGCAGNEWNVSWVFTVL